ncbi:Intraflagellar transport protein 74-like protein [Trichoplax sp. H2]|nr:Intraflagellar transport protein 74-like protein [Trichoplax sp. H2]|eukprot:RDD46218.1 Intraflagellar transport protein 74-like protein [Trichoplax sp. H2]
MSKNTLHPSQSNRPSSRSDRVGSASARRLQTGAQNGGTASVRPGSRAGGLGGGVLSSQITVHDRPMTQHGLSGMKTASKGPQRQVQDKTYYLGVLRAKIAELNTENIKLSREIDQMNQDSSTYITYEKKAEQLANEIKELQGNLGDYNTLLDKVTTDTGMEVIIENTRSVQVKNNREARKIDEIFTTRSKIEEQIRGLEADIEQERRLADNLVADMDNTQKAKYVKLKNLNAELQQRLESQQSESDMLHMKIQNMEEELSSSPIKQEAGSDIVFHYLVTVNLHQQLRELEDKRQSLQDEMHNESKGTPMEERERLLKQVKENSQESARMEKKLTEIENSIENTTAQIQQLDGELEESQGEQNIKLQELKKREAAMDEFLEKFEETKATEIENNNQMELKNVALLERISRNMIRSKHMPTQEEMQKMNEDLSFKEYEMQKSQSTVKGLDAESSRLQLDLAKVEQLENKITSELKALKDKKKTMIEELEKYKDIAGLKNSAEDKRKRLNTEKENLKKRKDLFKKVIESLHNQYEVEKNELNANETHSQLANLERKWQHYEQNNFVMKEFIESKTREGDYKPISKGVEDLLSEYNKVIMKRLQ